MSAQRPTDATQYVICFPGGGLRLDHPLDITLGRRGSDLVAEVGSVVGCDLATEIRRGTVGMHPGIAQVATMAVWLARFHDAVPDGAQDNIFLGHSAGEWTAAVAAGAIDLKTTTSILMERGELLEQLCGLDIGTMVMLVGPTIAEIDEWTRATDGVWLASENGARSATISVLNTRLREVEAEVESARFGELKRLGIPFPSHTPLMTPIAERLSSATKHAAWQAPRGRVFSATAFEWLADADVLRERTATNIARRVHWHAAISHIRAHEPSHQFVDLLPRAGMTSLLRAAGLRPRDLAVVGHLRPNPSRADGADD